MTTITKQTQHPIDLEKYKIDLGLEFGEKFYFDHLNQLSSERREELFGYSKNCCMIDLHKQNGQYIASRLLMALKGLQISPHKIFSRHQLKVLRETLAKKNCERWVEVSEEIKESVLNKMCDDYDNQS